MASNVDQKEQAKGYGDLSKYSQTIYGKNLLEHIQVKSNDTIAAVGCGTGDLAAYVAEQKVKVGKVVALDPDLERIKIAKEKFRCFDNLSFHEGTAVDVLKSRNEEFDVIYSNAVLHWIPLVDRLETFKAMYAALKPGGITGHHVGTSEKLKIGRRLAVLASPDEIRKLMQTVSPLTQEDIKGFAQESGFEIVSMKVVEEESKFPTVEEYLTWIEASFQGLLKIKEKYYKHEPKICLDESEDGTVTEVTTLLRIVMKKPC